MKYEKDKSITVCPNELPIELNIKNTLEEKQNLVGGLIEVCYLNDDSEVCLICNEEGRINNLQPNRFIDNDFIYGNFIVVGDDYKNGDFKSLTKKQVDKYQEFFNEKSIDKTNSRVVARKMVAELFKRRKYEV